MATLNMYQASEVRIEDGELRWGQQGCRVCKSRGWQACMNVENNLVIHNCYNCAQVETEEDADRLRERIYLLLEMCDDEGALVKDPSFEAPEEALEDDNFDDVPQ